MPEHVSNNQIECSDYQSRWLRRSDLQVDFLGEPTTGNLHLVERVSTQGVANVLGLQKMDDIFTIPFSDLKEKQQVTAPAAALGSSTALRGGKHTLLA